MANYTFTSSSCYSISTHSIEFTATEVIIKLISTGKVVLQKDFSSGLAFLCRRDGFCVGSLADSGTFSRKVDFNRPKAKLWFNRDAGDNAFWGTDNYDDPDVYNRYVLDDCPVRLSSSKNTVTIECPCESDSGPCSNTCYSYGR